MKRIGTAVVLAAVVITLILTSFLPAEATHSLGHLRRQIARLENQVGTLQQKLKQLSADVYQCEVWDTLAPFTFPDGTVGYPLYLDSRCT